MEWVLTAGADVQNIRFILNAIAAIFNSDALKALASILIMLSLFFALITYQTRPGGGLYVMGRWLVLFLFFYSMFHVKTTVTVRSASGISAPVQVANVPLPVAFFGSVFTNLDYAIARLFDDAFSVPGLLGGSRGIGFSSLDLYFRQGQDAVLTLVSSNNRYYIDNMNAFFDNCIVKTVMQGYISMETLQRQGWLGVASLVNPAFYTPVKSSNGSVEYKSCQDAISDFATAYNQLASLGTSSPLYRILFPSVDVTALNNMFVSGSTAAVTWLAGGTLSSGLNQILADAAAFNFFMQSLSRNSINPASFAEGYVKVAGETCMQGVMSQRYLPLMKTIMFYLVFGVLPLILLFLLTPMWKPTLMSVGTVGLWFAFWSALTSIFNGLVGLFARNAFSGYGGVVDPNSVLASVYFVNNFTDMACMTAGYASYIPVVALALASGSMYALTHVAGSLAGTVKAAGDRVTDAYDFAGRETAMASDAARGTSQYNAVSTTLAQADAVNAFAGGMHNMAYSNPFVKSTIVAAENQAYGIGAVMRHRASAKTDKIAYSSTVYDDLKDFALYNRLENSSHAFVNQLQAYAASRGIPLVILPTSSGYELFVNGAKVGEVKNGQVNILGTSFQLGGSLGRAYNVSEDALRREDFSQKTGHNQNYLFNQNAQEVKEYRRNSGSTLTQDSSSSLNQNKTYAGQTGDIKNIPLNLRFSLGGGSGSFGGSGDGRTPGFFERFFPSLLPNLSAGVAPQTSYQTQESWGFGRDISLNTGINTNRFDSVSKSDTFSLNTGYTSSQQVNRSEDFSNTKSVGTSYSQNKNENSNVSYNASVLPSKLADYVSQVTGLKPTTPNERALLSAFGAILTSLDKDFADGFLKTLANERLGMDKPPSEQVKEGMEAIKSEVDEKMKALDDLFGRFQEFIGNQQAAIKGKVDKGNPYAFYNPDAVRKFFEQNADKIPDAPTFEQWLNKKIKEAIDFTKDNWKEIAAGLLVMTAGRYGLKKAGEALDKLAEKAKNRVKDSKLSQKVLQEIEDMKRGLKEAVEQVKVGGKEVAKEGKQLLNRLVGKYGSEIFSGGLRAIGLVSLLAPDGAVADGTLGASLKPFLRTYAEKDPVAKNIMEGLRRGDPNALRSAHEYLMENSPTYAMREVLTGMKKELSQRSGYSEVEFNSIVQRLYQGDVKAVEDAERMIDRLLKEEAKK